MIHRFCVFAILQTLLAISFPSHAAGILVIGDSWASPIVGPLQAVLAEHGHSDLTVEYTKVKGTAQNLRRTADLAVISDWLRAHPETNIVHLSIGSNDWEYGPWTPGWAGTQTERDMCRNIVGWAETIVDHILSVRPGIQVVWAGYDFFRPFPSSLGTTVSQGTPAQINAIQLIIAEMARELARSKPGLSYVDTHGLLQVTYGFDGIQHSEYDPATPIQPGDPSLPDPSLPSPFEPFLPNDAWHLTPEGFKVIAEEQYAQAYGPLLDGEVFQINNGLNDAWYDPDTAGQGFLITVFPDISQLFLAWFTFDAERPDESVTAQLGEPGHRWLTAQGSYADNQAVLDLWVTKGGVFDAKQPAPGSEKAGTLILEFSDCNTATVSYEITSIDRQGVIPIERIALDNVALCEAMASSQSHSSAMGMETVREPAGSN